MNSEPFNNVTKPRHINFHSIIPESSHHCCIAWPEAKRENSIESTENSIIFHWIHSFLCHFYVISLMVVICCLGINEETFSKNQTQSRAMENTPTGQIRVTSSFEYVCMYSWMKNSNLYVSTALVARAAAQPQHSRTLVMQKTVRLHFVIKLQTAWKIVRNIRKTICVRKSIRIYVYQWYIFFNITHVQQTKKTAKKKACTSAESCRAKWPISISAVAICICNPFHYLVPNTNAVHFTPPQKKETWWIFTKAGSKHGNEWFMIIQ